MYSRLNSFSRKIKCVTAFVACIFIFVSTMAFSGYKRALNEDNAKVSLVMLYTYMDIYITNIEKTAGAIKNSLFRMNDENDILSA
ncbi:hypothetical protein RCU45_17130, partial [Escherichia coli]|nr:hypothetical protein [Escherichia coli]